MPLHVLSSIVLVIRRSKLYYTASGIVTLIGGHPVPTLNCRFKNVWHVCRNYCGCVLSVICVFYDRWIVLLRQKRDTKPGKWISVQPISWGQSTKSWQGPGTSDVFLRQNLQNYQIFKHSGILRPVEWYTIIFIFGVNSRWKVVPLFANNKFQ
jgi:hypothetical protein